MKRKNCAAGLAKILEVNCLRDGYLAAIGLFGISNNIGAFSKSRIFPIELFKLSIFPIYSALRKDAIFGNNRRSIELEMITNSATSPELD
jgi:hypothetical protein